MLRRAVRGREVFLWQVGEVASGGGDVFLVACDVGRWLFAAGEGVALEHLEQDGEVGEDEWVVVVVAQFDGEQVRGVEDVVALADDDRSVKHHSTVRKLRGQERVAEAAGTVAEHSPRRLIVDLQHHRERPRQARRRPPDDREARQALHAELGVHRRFALALRDFYPDVRHRWCCC